MTAVRMLEWDTRFFGTAIGQVDLGPECVDLDLDAIESQARELGLRCLYVRVAQPSDATLPHDLQAAGFRVVDIALTLTVALDGLDTAASSEVSVGTPHDLDSVGPTLDVLVPWSRFAADPAFGHDAARRMYMAWATRAATDDEELFVVRRTRSGGVAGLVTATGGPEPQLGLLAVSEPRRGHGGALINAAKAWAAQRGTHLLTATQARNVGAVRFYERHGFRTSSSSYVFHRWLRGAA